MRGGWAGACGGSVAHDRGMAGLLLALWLERDASARFRAGWLASGAVAVRRSSASRDIWAAVILQLSVTACLGRVVGDVTLEATRC